MRSGVSNQSTTCSVSLNQHYKMVIIHSGTSRLPCARVILIYSWAIMLVSSYTGHSVYGVDVKLILIWIKIQAFVQSDVKTVPEHMELNCNLTSNFRKLIKFWKEELSFN